ncbi:protocadherin Fat 1-like [Petromyzon marinus]|uniref:protocadherin Fat 1-like n=1 Tax=Petromyzon marinus TaxID=7757 RepID=UPI003F70C12C
MASALLPLLLLLLLPPCRKCLDGQRGRPKPALRFTSLSYKATVYENSAPGTYVESHDKMGIHVGRSAPGARYAVVSGDEGAAFEAEGLVVGDFWFLRVRTRGVPLDREERRGYALGVKAFSENGRGAASATVFVQVLDRNDLNPLFSALSYAASVANDAPAGTTVLRVAATDADEGPNGRFSYALARHSDAFAVHPTSGAVTLARRLTEPGDAGLHEFKVMAVDGGGLSGSARVAVNVSRANAHAPRVTVVATRGQGAPFADPAAAYAELVAVDRDAGPEGEIVAVEIVAGDPLRAFSVAPTDGAGPASAYAVRLSGRLDWADFPFGVNLTVQARDGGRPPRHSRPVTVTLRGGGAAGAFERSVYACAVERRSPPRAVVLAVRASCGARGCRYVVRGGADGDFFAVNPATGVVSVRESLAAVDRRRFEFNVGTDAGPGVAGVAIDVADYNAHAPVFERPNYSASLSEDVPAGTFVLILHAADDDEGDDGRVTYGLAEDEPGPFAVDPRTGIVVTTGPLDHEEMAGAYRLRVRASDWGTPFRREAEATVTVNVTNMNDNAPVFKSVDCVGEIPRDLRPGEPIFTASAIDADELRPVLYGIASGNEGGFFALDGALGVVTLARSLADVAAGPAGAFRLGLTATDGELSAETAFLNVSVVDAAPGRAPSWRCVETGIARRMVAWLHRANQWRDRPRPLAAGAVNRHAPAFAAPAVAVEVREDLPVGAEVTRMEATDPDDGFEGKLLYALTDDGGASGLAVDAETGVVRVLVPLDREAAASYLVNIVVRDLGTPRRSASAALRVVVSDVNDNRPEFSRRAYEARVPESARPGREVLRLEAADGDAGAAGVVRYRLLSDTDLFRVDAETGALEVAAPLDRERRAEHALLVEASDLAPEESRLSSVAAVTVTVEDVDDHAPACAPAPLRLRVPEDFPVGAVLGWLDARDPDAGPAGEVRYSLPGEDEDGGTFGVHETSGALRLARPLDFERRRRHDLTVAARDGDPGGPPPAACRATVEVVDVDENDHAPRFAEFAAAAAVREDAPVGAVVVTVTATDEDRGIDGEVRYSLVDESGLGVFSIHPENGMIVTVQPLDRETADSYWLTVRATDRGVVPRFSTLHVYVDVQDVNDNPPRASRPWYQAAVAENSRGGVRAVQVDAWDLDNAAAMSSNDARGRGLTFNIVSGDPQGFFTINNATGVIHTTSRRLDRERQAEHELEVSIVDGGVPPREARVAVTLSVSDENDNAPRFRRNLTRVYAVAAKEPTVVAIARVYAADADWGNNGMLLYTVRGWQHNYYSDEHGVVYSRSDLHRAGTSHSILIEARDSGQPPTLPSTAVIHVEWIAAPRPPETPAAFGLSRHAVTVSETAAVGSVVIALPTQSTAGSLLWFSITGGDVERSFHVTEHSGVVEVAKPLDAERCSSYRLTVTLTDGTNASTTLVVVTVQDVNDHRPRFSRDLYEATVTEDASPGASRILRLEATDADAGAAAARLSFFLVGVGGGDAVEGRRLFRVDPVTGEVTVAERLDREAKWSHVLTVMVQDGGVPVRRAYATLAVSVDDANDHAPRFTGGPYEARVAESAAVGSAVVRVTATDRDDGPNADVRYSIRYGNVGNSFAVHRALGVVFVARKLNGSAVEAYELTVRAVDRGRPRRVTNAAVRVVVVAADADVPPEFASGGGGGGYSAEVAEGAAPGSFVLAVSASGRSTVAYEIREGDPEGAFDIHPTSGVVAAKRPLDRERTPSYRLTVRATDAAGLSTDASVTIRVLDENDNGPVFDRPRYHGAVGEEAAAGTPVLDPDGIPLVVRAADADDGEGRATVAYGIVEFGARKYFSVDPRTGAIRVARALDRETTAEFRFRVTASDGGSPRMSAEAPAEVTVAVLDANDCPPAFSTAAYKTTLTVPTRAGVRLLTLAASDPDVGAALTYRVASGNVGGAFAMDARTGDVEVRNASLLAAGYDLGVEVSDGKFRSAARVKVSVRAVGGRLRVPPKISARIPENGAAGAVVAAVVATGGDLNEPLVFDLLDPSGAFRMRPTAGVLETAGVTFDREERDRYELLVEVRGGSRARPSVARTVVEVAVEDVNDNAPAFVGLPYRAVVGAAAAPGSAVLTVAALDRDVGENARVRYSLRDDRDGRFRVRPSGGEILLRTSFAPGASGKDFVVTVVATDCGTPPLSSAVGVTVTVLDEDAPAFKSLSHVAWVPEDVGPPAPIAHVRAAGPEGLPLVFSIVDGDPFDQFSVDFGTGVVSVVGSLDRETRANYRLAVRAASPTTGLHADASLDVVVGDVNDNRPLFARGAYAARLSESAPPGTSVVRVSAVDTDAGPNGALRYEIVDDGEKGGEGFYVDPDGGLVVTTAPLDHERSRLRRFSVRATDGGSPPLASDVTVTVAVEDANDNAPVFERPLYEASVSRLSWPGHFVAAPRVLDADASDAYRLRYAIVSGDDDPASFAIDAETGVVSVAVPLERKKLAACYHLRVSATDGAFVGDATLAVDVRPTNRHAPAFERAEYAAEIPENSVAGTPVASVRATDADAGAFGRASYSIANRFARERFTVDGSGRIFARAPLDREDPSQRAVDVRVVARDGGGRAAFATVRVVATDENDNAPRFVAAEYSGGVPASAAKGTAVLRVAATDRDEGRNAAVIYSLRKGREPDASEDVLEVEPLTGRVITKGGLAGLEGSRLSFFVVAEDGGGRVAAVPTSVAVLPAGPAAPAFAQAAYELTVTEDARAGSVVGAVAAALAGDEAAAYAAVPGGGSGVADDGAGGGAFAVVAGDGRIVVARALDREAAGSHRFEVRATWRRGGADVTAQVPVTVRVEDVEDEAPVFESSVYEATVLENLPGGVLLVQVRATDRDGGAQPVHNLVELRESGDAGEAEPLFMVDARSGWVSTLSRLDCEARDRHHLLVEAFDPARPERPPAVAKVLVIVSDANDHPPRFSASVIDVRVPEDAAPGLALAVVQADDADAAPENRDLTYHLTGGDPLGHFSLGPVKRGGEWTLRLERPLDREEQERHHVLVMATDGTLVRTVVVAVTVLDVNDNGPVCDKLWYNVTVREDVAPQVFLLRVSARDSDSGSNGTIGYSLHGAGANLFRLDSVSGELFTLAPLDREAAPAHALAVAATDGGGRSCRAEVLVRVEDVDDSAPRFLTGSPPRAVALRLSHAGVGTAVTSARAVDADLGPHRRVTHSLLNSAGDRFAIDGRSGVITVKRPLESRDVYNLTVLAHSGGGASATASSTAVISVSLHDDDDERGVAAAPAFRQLAYRAAVPEDAAPGNVVVAVAAVLGGGGAVSYGIAGGNELGAFDVDRRLGVIRVAAKALDYEKRRHHYLTVWAAAASDDDNDDAAGGAATSPSAVTVVTVDVTDVDDDASAVPPMGS